MKNKKIYSNDKQVVEYYVNHNKTCLEISKEMQISRRNIYEILKRNSIELKSRILENPTTCIICNKKIANLYQSNNSNKCGTCLTNLRRFLIKKFAVEYKGGKCDNCGFKGNVACYDFHHINPKEKKFSVNAVNLANKKWKIVKQELDKCQLLCSNCHRLTYNNYDNSIFIKESQKYNGKLFK